MLTFASSGSFAKMDKFLSSMQSANFRRILEAEGERGRQALIRATPRDSGITASSWGYTTRQNRGSVSIVWTNTTIKGGVPLVVMLQFGHGTGTGGYVQGRDFINPAMKPVFDQIADNVWKAVTSA